MAVTQGLIDLITSLFTNQAEQKAFAADPEAYLTEHGITGCTATDVHDAVGMAAPELQGPPAQAARQYLSQADAGPATAATDRGGATTPVEEQAGMVQVINELAIAVNVEVDNPAGTAAPTTTHEQPTESASPATGESKDDGGQQDEEGTGEGGEVDPKLELAEQQLREAAAARADAQGDFQDAVEALKRLGYSEDELYELEGQIRAGSTTLDEFIQNDSVPLEARQALVRAYDAKQNFDRADEDLQEQQEQYEEAQEVYGSDESTQEQDEDDATGEIPDDASSGGGDTSSPEEGGVEDPPPTDEPVMPEEEPAGQGAGLDTDGEDGPGVQVQVDIEANQEVNVGD